MHVNTRHTSRFTVVGNHLAQHRELSLLAIGLAVHIQSLPTGTRIDIKTLAARFPEGAQRIAGALRELEAHGYLRRVRERTPDGRITTRTLSCNQPAARDRASETGTRAAPPPAPEVGAQATPPPAPDPAPAPAPGPVPAQAPGPVAPPPGPDPAPVPAPAPGPAPAQAPGPVAPPPGPDPAPAPPCGTGPARTPRRLPAPLPVPQPAYPSPSLLRAAVELLAGLHRHDPRLLLSARDTEQLAPGAATWLERGASPEGVQHALSARLPAEPLYHPAAFLAHRLTTELPPPATGPVRAPHPLQNCDLCDRAFRAPEPGVCGDCRALPAPPERGSRGQPAP
ncbi:helix-turn-helix domain-containing protein [Streptomyces somaliensis]|nr:helix-turn-helix domain-containing protein [Streptomyces somaliensis]MCP9944978.1 helix-turn-helix domain-containing protein [Streptomyces somaliensis]MCP9974619.1 helix-turn-helix domain-containing protein [Streptomyces somaliensis]